MKQIRNVLIVLGWHDPRAFLGIGRYARRAGWHLTMRMVFDGTVSPDWRGDGMLFSVGGRDDLLAICRRQATRHPAVRLGANAGGVACPSVQDDDEAAGALAARHFLDRGYRHFAWVTTQEGEVANRRREGFRLAVEQAGRAAALWSWPAERGRCRDTWANCHNWIARCLTRAAKPLALFVLDDQLAADVIEVCGSIPLRVPEDVAVMGVGNIEMACECSRVPISSVDLAAERGGYEAARLLDRLMAGQPAPRRPIVLAPLGVVQRQSTDAYAAEHPALVRAVAFIADRYDSPINVADVVRAAGVSRRMLNYLFARELGRSPGRHLLRLRLDKARALLGDTDAKVAEIAEACGFDPVRNFHRCFRRELGTTPLAYRRAAHASE